MRDSLRIQFIERAASLRRMMVAMASLLAPATSRMRILAGEGAGVCDVSSGIKSPIEVKRARPALPAARKASENVQHLGDERVANHVALLQTDNADVALHALDLVGDGREARHFRQ